MLHSVLLDTNKYWQAGSKASLDTGLTISTSANTTQATGNLTWSSADIINVHSAHVDGDELATSTNIGFIYSSVGLGCLLGPIAANCFTDMSRPATLQIVSIAALIFVVAGWLGMAAGNNSDMTLLCLFNSIRAFGSSIIWINSTLVLQVSTAIHRPVFSSL